VGFGPIALAQRLLTEMNLTGTNPNHRPAFLDKVSPDISARSTVGFTEQMDAAAKSTLQI
jgi:hypothetical protein